MSSLSDWVAVTISPCWSRKRTTSAAVRFSLGPMSWAVEPRSMMISPFICTMNYIFQKGDTIAIGTAGHCLEGNGVRRIGP